MLYLQSWPKLCGTSLQNALPRPSISFSHGNKRSLGQILPSPSPPCNVVRKERLADESSNIASGGKGGASEYCRNSGKRHFVPHILARIVGPLTEVWFTYIQGRSANAWNVRYCLFHVIHSLSHQYTVDTPVCLPPCRRSQCGIMRLINKIDWWVSY